MIKASLIASLTGPPSGDGAELRALPKCVDWLEVRGDLVADISPDWLRDRFKGQLAFALRSQDEGGAYSDSLDGRRRRLLRAAQGYDRVELEVGRDLSSSLLRAIPATARSISWHGPVSQTSDLESRLAQMFSVPAGLYKLQLMASTMADEFLPLTILKSLGRHDTVAFADGPMGFWTRLAALQLGAPAIYGLVKSNPQTPQEPAIGSLIEDYGLPAVSPIRQLNAIIGSPIFHSLSPRLHNASYRSTHYPALFIPLQVKDFEEFWREAVTSRVLGSLGFALQGMTVASPHKEAALLKAGAVSVMAQRAESANILVRSNGSWKADTTDPHVVFMAHQKRNIQLRHKRAAVIGCGGAGRAIAAALAQSGAGVTLVNRGAERGEHASALLRLPYLPLPEFNADGYDIVVNATPVGRDTDETPFNIEGLAEQALVIDLVYRSRPTSLVDKTVARAHQVIDGRDVLLTQVLQQFRMMTGREMSPELALEALGRQATEICSAAEVPLMVAQ
ncbi:MAG TPA: type I 3-dehydroquinate dehydratase [Pyrinomonadaceae bacterium]|nr:type I 3-dehydroquinate dehydratase [Pyrinomonadaceae bacterium]